MFVNVLVAMVQFSFIRAVAIFNFFIINYGSIVFF